MDVKEWLVTATARPGTVMALGFVEDQGVLRSGHVSIKVAVNGALMTDAQMAQCALDELRSHIRRENPNFVAHLPACIGDGQIEVWALPHPDPEPPKPDAPAPSPALPPSTPLAPADAAIVGPL